MKTSIGEQVSKILSAEKQGGLPRTMLDVLRVLLVNRGTSWKSELIQDVALLHSFLGEPETVEEKGLEEALRELRSRGLVRVEERIRGDLGVHGGIKDTLVSLADFVATQSALLRDKTLTAYIYQRMAKAREETSCGL